MLEPEKRENWRVIGCAVSLWAFVASWILSAHFAFGGRHDPMGACVFALWALTAALGLCGNAYELLAHRTEPASEGGTR